VDSVLHLLTEQLLVVEHLHPGQALRAQLANADLPGPPVPLHHQLGRDNPGFLKATSKQPFSRLQANSLSQGYKQTAFLKVTSEQPFSRLQANNLSQGYKQNSPFQGYQKFSKDNSLQIGDPDHGLQTTQAEAVDVHLARADRAQQCPAATGPRRSLPRRALTRRTEPCHAEP